MLASRGRGAASDNNDRNFHFGQQRGRNTEYGAGEGRELKNENIFLCWSDGTGCSFWMVSCVLVSKLNLHTDVISKILSKLNQIKITRFKVYFILCNFQSLSTIKKMWVAQCSNHIFSGIAKVQFSFAKITTSSRGDQSGANKPGLSSRDIQAPGSEQLLKVVTGEVLSRILSLI